MTMSEVFCSSTSLSFDWIKKEHYLRSEAVCSHSNIYFLFQTSDSIAASFIISQYNNYSGLLPFLSFCEMNTIGESFYSNERASERVSEQASRGCLG